MVRAQELVLSFLLFLSFTSLSHHSSQGFRLPITHRDSPRSPFYNPNATVSDRWKSAYKRSIARHNYVESVLNRSYSPVAAHDQQASVGPIGGEYLTYIQIGTPPQETSLVVDTTGDLVWTQCLPCTKCHPQTDPLFDPSKSSTYSKYSCFSVPCDDLLHRQCLPGDTCGYSDTYTESTTSGILSSDTFIMEASNGSVVHREMIFGCGNSNIGSFTREETGRLGLSGGPLSLITQLGIENGWRFSHCFVPHYTRGSEDSHLYIGRDAIMLGNSTPFTIIQFDDDHGVFYSLPLKDISVGSERLNIPPGTFDLKDDGTGGVIIDSASPHMFLSSVAFDKLVVKLREVIKLEPVRGPDDAPALCYKGTTDDLVKVATVTLHFSNLDVPLHGWNTFGEMVENVVCLLVESTHGTSIIGNYAQQNMNVGFDLNKQALTMTPFACSTF